MRTLLTGTSIKRSGFTLVELLVVIVVLSLVSLISLPLLADRGEGEEKLKMRRIAGTVKQLYNEATLTRDEHLLTFDFTRNSMLAYRLRSSGGVIEKEPFGSEITLSPLRVQQIDIAGKGSFRNGQISVRVFPLGWMEATQIELQRGNGTGVHLSFSPLTGTTTINEERLQRQ
ncbi:MAG: prepilin-type N-terminal cleavage/methylation domain-containing protein [Deltaproteobacteria bacterium]|jgi:general secretion pathway protein H|nr:prepilin-type N-terminal cleavage/methylation domain-containing protein [Deltaproteobacteria bacterium]MCW8893403.1 prepilin-type N-terminal cleavage/methylation domain-containing protein [Deltaproteobacteria bacterium]MCW9050124.1 prepilin-type N-terminal cleavage/methylation domain-containing protein [Deltaproteobacteria bacterium]